MAPVEGRIVPLKFNTVQVLSVLAIAEVSKIRNGAAPTVNPVAAFITPPLSDKLPDVSAVVAPVAIRYLPVVIPVRPVPEPLVPHVTVKGLSEVTFR